MNGIVGNKMLVHEGTSAQSVQSFIEKHGGNVKAEEFAYPDGSGAGYILHAVDKGPGFFSSLKQMLGIQTSRTLTNKAFEKAINNTYGNVFTDHGMQYLKENVLSNSPLSHGAAAKDLKELDEIVADGNSCLLRPDAKQNLMANKMMGRPPPRYNQNAPTTPPPAYQPSVNREKPQQQIVRVYRPPAQPNYVPVQQPQSQYTQVNNNSSRWGNLQSNNPHKPAGASPYNPSQQNLTQIKSSPQRAPANASEPKQSSHSSDPDVTEAVVTGIAGVCWAGLSAVFNAAARF